MSVSLKPLRIRKVRLDAEVVASVARAFEGIENTTVTPIRKGRKGYLGCKFDNYLFVGVQTQSKQVLGLVDLNKGSIVFPSTSEYDLLTAAKALGFTDGSQLIWLFEFSNLEYGLFEKSEPARLLRDEVSFEKAGLLKRESNKLSREWESLWWQPWGGKLYGVNASLQSVEILKTRSRAYDRLPIWLVK